MATRGIDIRQTADRIVLRVSLKDSAGDKVTTGTTELRVYRVEDDGTLDVLDWDAGVKDFVASGAVDDEVTMTHQQSNGADDTGIWTYVMSDATILANFDSGQVYIAQVTNSGAAPESQEREFQFGSYEGQPITAAQISDAVLLEEVADHSAMIGSLADYINRASVAATLPSLAQILAGGDVDGFSVEETLKLCLSALAGILSGAATSEITIRAADNSKVRIVATVDADGNRTAITTLDASG